MIQIRWTSLLPAMMLGICISGCDAAKILALFPLNARSHMIFNSALAKELAERGHEVTVLSPFPEEKTIPNYRDIAIQKLDVEELLGALDAPNLFDLKDMGYIEGQLALWQFGNLICERSLQDPATQKLIHSTDEHFDLILMESFYMDCFIGFAHKFKTPVIEMCANEGREVLGDLIGNPNPFSYVPDLVQEFSDRMTFKERLINTLGGIFQKLGRQYHFLPIQDDIMRKYFNYTDNLSSISELEKSVALILVNHHFSIGYPRPLLPNLVLVGGMHVKPPKALPADIKKFLDEAEHGAIYFSMGSNLKSSQMPNNTLKAFLHEFSKLKQKVLWTWESESFPGKPENVKVGKWLPQSDILAHPNVRLFITHGGLMSTQETILRGVPVICIPIYGDQRINTARAEASGFGIKLEFSNITSESIHWAIDEVLGNPRYRQNIQRLSQLFRDQPLTPMEQAVFWTEYVIRHKGAPHMRSAVLDLAWYQYFLLDVIAVLLLLTGSLLAIAILTIKVILKFVSGGSKLKVNNRNKND